MEKNKRIQCDAEYKIYDSKGNLIVTFYCLKIKNHFGEHNHTLRWNKKIGNLKS